MTPVQALSIAPLSALFFAAMLDLAYRRVPNWVAVVTISSGLALRLASGDILASVVLLLTVFAALYACWRRGWLGGGDVKLLTAVTSLVPAHSVADLILAISVAGGVLALIYLFGRSRSAGTARRPCPPRKVSGDGASLTTTLRRIGRIEAWRIRRGGPLPYACAIAAGTFVTLMST